MSQLHVMCKAAFEQRQFDWRCSNAFGASKLALLFVMALSSTIATAQITTIRPISKPAAPPVAPPVTVVVELPAPLVLVTAAKEFRSLGDLPAILYDAPSVKAKKLSILSGLNPLEILARTDRWAKVRDAAGEMGWVETNLLTERRLVTVVANLAQIRVAAVGTEPVTFEAERGVVLETISSTQDGWLAVRHRDGNAGFVLRSQVFGQ